MKIFIIIILLLSSCSTATQRKEANDNPKVNSAITPRVVEYLENASSYDRASISNTHHRITVAPDPANINFVDGTSYPITQHRYRKFNLYKINPTVTKKKFKVYGVEVVGKSWGYYGNRSVVDKYNIILTDSVTHSPTDFNLLYDKDSYSITTVARAKNSPYNDRYYSSTKMNPNALIDSSEVLSLPLDLFGIAHVWVFSFKSEDNVVENHMILDKIDFVKK